MRKGIVTFLVLFFVLTAFSQSEVPAKLFYDLQATPQRAISQLDLRGASTLSDIDMRFPRSWVKEYISVEIITTCNGVKMSATGINDQLNAKQKDILKRADYGTEVLVDVKYMPENNLKHNVVQTIDFRMPVLPEVEAKFPGGSDKMMQYLEENIAKKIPASITIRDIQWAAVKFTINKIGEIGNVQIIGTTEFEEIDKILIDAICGMPQWKPAIDANKVQVEQEFEFVLGNSAAMCNLNFFFMNNYFLTDLNN